MKLERLLELSGQKPLGTQLNELYGVDVKHNKDNISTLKAKLKKANVDVAGMSDINVLKFANAMDEITVESIQSDKTVLVEMEDGSIIDKFEMALTKAGFDVSVNGNEVELSYKGESLVLHLTD